MDCLPLTPKQLDALPQETDKAHKPVRFMVNGQSANICTGQLSRKGSNVIYHVVYWDRPKVFVDAVLAALRENNPECKVIASYSE